MEIQASKTNIRKALFQDADSLFYLIDSLADYEKLQKPSDEAKERMMLDFLGDFPRASAWLAEYENKPVGYAITFYTYSTFLGLPTLYIEDIFVLKEYRGRGLGKELFNFCAKLALAEGCGRMEWLVLDWNQTAIDFYEKAGAKKMKEWELFRMTREDLLKFVNNSQ